MSSFVKNPTNIEFLVEVGDLYIEKVSPFDRIIYFVEKTDGRSLEFGNIFVLRRFIQNCKPDTCYMYEFDMIEEIKNNNAELYKRHKTDKI